MASRIASLNDTEDKKTAENSEPRDFPSDLAMTMIEKELELEKTWSSEVIHDLIHLYSEAIEFYSKNNNEKYTDFKNRMHKMLMKPQVLKSLQNENKASLNHPTKKSSERKTTQEAKLAPSLLEDSSEKSDLQTEDSQKSSFQRSFTQPEADIKAEEPVSPSKSPKKIENLVVVTGPTLPTESSHESISPINNVEHIQRLSNCSPLLKKPHPNPRNSYGLQVRLVNPRNLKMVVDRHSSNTKDTATRAVNDFKSQDSALARRLASRQQLKHTRSMSFTIGVGEEAEIYGDSSDSDKSLSKNLCLVIEEHAQEIDLYEKKLEEIMEKNHREKARKIAEIKHSYETQINEVSSMGSSMKILVEEMRKNMAEEILKTTEEYDLLRKQEISKLKESELM